MIHHKFKVVPGYDCRERCEHKVKGDHGVSAEVWVFTVVDRDVRAALELQVYTTRYPSTCSAGRGAKCVGGNMVLHFGYATSKEQVLSAPCSGCELMSPCYEAGIWGTRADDIVAAHLDPGAAVGEQPRLWAALEAELATRAAWAEGLRREDGDLRWQKCECCGGAGAVAREVTT